MIQRRTGPQVAQRATPVRAPDSSTVDRSSRALRVDARRNRDQIIDAAKTAFAEIGLGATMTEVAPWSGVGIATLYRRFPTKDHLVSAAFLDQFIVCKESVEDALAEDDPWRGFCDVIGRLTTMLVLDRGFTAAFTAAYPDASEFAGERKRLLDEFARLVDRAKASGELRTDFDPSDLTIIVMAVGGIEARHRGDATRGLPPAGRLPDPVVPVRPRPAPSAADLGPPLG